MNEIWLIDDDRIQNLICSKLLNRMYPEAKLVSFINPLVPLQKLLNGGSPCMILLDINMPEMNGFDFLENLNLREISAKIIMLSSSINPNDILKSELYPQVLGYITKPLTKGKMEGFNHAL